MLDAAHGESVRPVAVVQRIHSARVGPLKARVDIACGVGRGRPIIAVRADARQGSRLAAAVARGRGKHVKSNRWNE